MAGKLSGIARPSPRVKLHSALEHYRILEGLARALEDAVSTSIDANGRVDFRVAAERFWRTMRENQK